jgi:hypothetical protein
MAISLDNVTGFNGNTVGGAGGLVVTFTGFTAASGTMVSVGTAAHHPTILPTITSITYNGVALTGDRFNTFQSGFGSCQNFYSAPASPIGDGSPHDIVVTVDTTNTDVTLGISSWLGVGSVNDSLTNGNLNGIGTTASATVSTSAAGELIVDSLGVNANTTATADVSQTQIYSVTQASAMRGAGSWKPGAASVALSWTLGASSAWILQSMALIPSAAGGVPTRHIAKDTPGLAVGSVRRM